MIARWYNELENKFPEIKCHEMIVMPDHFHCIIEITVVGASVGADLCVCPVIAKSGEYTGSLNSIRGEHAGSFNSIPGDHAGSPLRRVIQWFKTMTTNDYIRGVKNLGWKPFNKRLWQRNYYEHIIRNERSREKIANYILNNPANWGRR